MRSPGQRDLLSVRWNEFVEIQTVGVLVALQEKELEVPSRERSSNARRGTVELMLCVEIRRFGDHPEANNAMVFVDEEF
jgi:hypothetical protein